MAGPIQGHEYGGHAVQQPSVVGHQDERAWKFQQAIFQHVERRDIQIVGRFVEKKQVGRLQHESRDQQSGLLSTGQPGDRQIELFGPKKKPLGPGHEMHRAILIDHGISRRSQGAFERPWWDLRNRDAARNDTTRRRSARTMVPPSGGNVPAKSSRESFCRCRWGLKAEAIAGSERKIERLHNRPPGERFA